MKIGDKEGTECLRYRENSDNSIISVITTDHFTKYNEDSRERFTASFNSRSVKLVKGQKNNECLSGFVKVLVDITTMML